MGRTFSSPSLLIIPPITNKTWAKSYLWKGFLSISSPLYHQSNLLSFSILFHILVFVSIFYFFFIKSRYLKPSLQLIIFREFLASLISIFSIGILKQCISVFSVYILHCVVPIYGCPEFLNELVWKGLNLYLLYPLPVHSTL